jgi:membrane protein YqaA with SNARE-associated domain
MKPVRALYDWVLHWAATPYGVVALVLLAMAEASFFPIPPDVLLLAICMAKPAKSLHYAALCTLGSVVGGMVGYAIGWGLWELMADFFFTHVPGFTPEIFQKVGGFYAEWSFYAVFLAGLTPIPYKVFTVAGGVFGINFPIFILASTLSRGLRFGIEGILIQKFGPPMAEFIDKYFNWLTLGFGVLLVGGFVVLRYVF